MPHTLLRFAGLAGATLILAACAGSASQPGLPLPPQSMGAPAGLHVSSAAAAMPTIVFSDTYGNIAAYDARGQFLDKILGPNSALQGIDGDSNLWVSASAYQIAEYPPPYVVPKRTLADPDGTPVSVAVDSHPGTGKGLIAVINRPTVYGFESISFYRPTDKVPCKTVKVGERSGFGFPAFDADGKLYLLGYTQRSNRMIMGVVTGGCNATSVEPMTIAKNVYYPTGLQIGPNGDFAIVSDTYGFPDSGTLDTYRHPVGKSLGLPITSTVLGPVGTQPGSFALAHDGRTYWAYDYTISAIYEYAYPNGSTPLVTIYLRNYFSYIVVGPAYVP